MNRLTVVVVGAGPSGCYAAHAIAKALPEAEVTVVDRLPVPYGLVRYGVAADHQGTKGITNQFERMFDRFGVKFVGAVELGRDFDLTSLREVFDIVVLATGLDVDRTLGIPGDDLLGVLPSGVLTRALNSYPTVAPPQMQVGRRVAVVGAGNIAVDVIRTLSRTEQEWAGSDMDPNVMASIVPSPVETIHVLVRGTPEQAKWDAEMLRELAGLERPTFKVVSVRSARASGQDELVDAVADLERRGGGDGSLTVEFSFESRLAAIVGDRCVEGAEVRTAGGSRVIGVDTVVTAIGFIGQTRDWPVRVYPTGWLATGPRGKIPAQRQLAKNLVTRIVRDIDSGTVTPGRAGRAGAPQMDSLFDHAAWMRIDAHERNHASDGRVRAKVSDPTLLSALAREGTPTYAKENAS